MANSKSAIKRWHQSLKRRDRNRATRSGTRNAVRTLREAAVGRVRADPGPETRRLQRVVQAQEPARERLSPGELARLCGQRAVSYTHLTLPTSDLG